ncbi:MAG TPA: potassium-transporting ATPase subunit KdpC [Anaerolineaceae bacterium]
MTRKELRPTLTLFASLAVITGLLYPLTVTGLAQVIFPHQANGSLITKGGQVAEPALGSALIGQQFTDPRYFWGRLSATSGSPYNASASGGSNYSVLNPDLEKQAQARLAALHAADPNNRQPVPVDLVTASASGLDPHISVAAARYQSTRVARLRGLPVDQVLALVDQYTKGRMLGFLGEPRINVLQLNLALDGIQ